MDISGLNIADSTKQYIEILWVNGNIEDFIEKD